ncbi:hypothetical protein Mgra_00003168 [Meloidogyne graminicola]|uniref:Transcriptional regulator ATRX n=1 Tax=Meloidogyne graminicola TaxID=189291 RepID=A0A8S9ZWI2_9BILA|nr:hypothetical protein Mgra_00003168 [Meloidogyne graminicola]
METDDILAKAATPQSEVVVQISEDPLESVKIFVKTSCPKSVELCYDCSNTIKKLAMEGQQIDTKESKDDEAIKKYGVGKCEVEINNSDFERLIKLIERNYHKKHLDGDNSTENDIDSELDRQLRSTKNLLKEKSSKGRRTSNSSIVYETEYEDDEVDGDLKENCCISGTGPSQSPISVQNSKKPNLCSIIDKQTKNAGEGGSNTSDEWLSKETGDNSGEPNNSDIDSDSDKDTTFISKIPTLTPAQQQSDKEMRRLLRSSNIKILDSDDSDATVLKSDDGSDSDSDGKINCKTKSKRPIINSFDGEYCASNKESFSEDISNSNEPKKRMTAKKSHIDKNLTDSGGSKKKKRRIIYSDDDSDEKSSVADENNKVNDDEKLAKNIDRQKFASKRRLTQETREAEKAEKERRKRLEEKQREFNGIELIDDEDGNMSILYGQVTTTLKSITLDPDTILGHCMGLGKTLQIIAFLHTILTHEKITKKINKVLVVVPKNVVLNWMNEFEKWLCGETDSINYLELDSWKTHEERLKAIKRWINYDRPSVLIIGYELFRILTLTEEDKAFMKKNKNLLRKKPLSANEKKLIKLRPQFCEYLQNAPHMIICDEGHKIKSPTTGLFYTINKIKTVRRICMTGTPLQNNLEEYYCMVNFVKPNLLGSLDEFKQRFSNIIKAGRSKDASVDDVRRMRKRCHVLFDRLKCVLDWRDYSVLRNSLPPKQEYVINIRLTKLQINLYKKYLDFRNVSDEKIRGEFGMRLLYDHLIFYRIWTHPYLLLEHIQREQNKAVLDDFIVDDDEEYVSETESNFSDNLRNNLKINDNPSPSLEDWAKSLISEEDRNNFEISNKLMLLIEIIKKCEKIGDKLLVFSQFLSSIALIERMLKYITQKTGWFVDGHRALMMADGEEWGWFKGIDYGVIDGSVSMISRDQIQKDFNDPLNLRNRLLLISTRAGSLGTNLIGANRVIIFDCSWNPSHDTQSLFRVYRFGQVKPVYIYRFVAQGTMEERIYNRQVTKESIAKRVTQAAQIQRHYTSQELEEMYIFEPDILSIDNIDGQGPRLNPPKDRLLGDIILEKTDAIVSYHPHDILFDELEDEKLTDEEREEAWKDYERERAGRASQQQNVLNMEVHAQQVKIITALQQQFSGQHSQFGRDLRILFNTYVHDSIYNKCLTFKGMTPDMAMNIFRMKAFLGYFIYHVPQNLAGEMNNAEKVTRVFMEILDKKKSIIYINDEDILKLSDDDDMPEYAGNKSVIPVKLAPETINAEKSEKERRKRLEESKCAFNGIELNTDDSGCSLFEYEHGNPTLKSITLDPDSDSNPPMPVCVHPSLVKILKKHQAEGIQFLYNCTIESVTRLEEPGGGAILGHCMGLGKTLQIIAFLHTILTHEKITKKINKVLVVVPKNVVLNWMNEFEKWLCGETDSINYLELDSWKTHEERLKAIKRWINYDRPSVLIIGYELFRILTLTEEDKAFMKKNKRKNIPLKKKPPTSNEKKLESLRPQFSPHLIVCDEGHKLKSPTTGLFHTINKVKTVRRICMTGTPLQNNLEEYYCMVNFVKPNLLGSLDEFKQRFSNIIKAGRAKDASDYDVRRMRRRCHVLFDRLKCVLDWRDYSVLRNSLPPKQEYVINIRLTKIQIDLYKNYLDCRNLNEDNPGGEVGLRLIYDHIILYRIWTHPYLLIEHVKREQNKCSQSLIDDFINADEYISESESDISDDIVIMNNMNVAGDGPSTSSNQNNVFEKKSLKRIRNNLKINDNPSPSLEDWAKSLISEEDRNNFEISNKLMLLIEIIKKCEKIGDKLLVFSQFLSSIALIERMLKYITQKTGWFVDGHRALMMADGEEWGWFKGIDYGVIDGSVSMISRDQIQKDFNDPLNLRNRLLLISTRAGSLGTNLIGANRVIIFDCSWNPSHDTQSLFRVYRFGQVKPVYIYRFVAQGTMEERIYNRQVTKESIAKRVTQAAQIQRHYTSQELEEMYIFEPDILSTDNIDGQGPRLNPPKDRLLGDIILEKTDAIVSYHPHDILFDELEDEKLTAEERAEAWKDYEREKAGISTDNVGMPFDARLGSFIPSNQLLQQQSSYHLAMQQQFQLSKAMELLFQLFRSDRIYNRSLKVNGMTHHMAMSIFKIKAFLSYFIHLVPENLAGKLNDSEGVKKYFVNIIDQAVQQKESPQVLYNKALLILRITIDLVRDVPNCSIGVRYISNLFPEVESIKTNITTF